eukprot:m.71104 g.71104  ORF g.71104 m.71104 type:complete len:359 (-) comp14344_c0_seq1:562-1638(-)
MEKHQAAISKVLAKIECRRLPLPACGKVVTIPASLHIPDAVNVLVTNGFSAAPVVDPTCKSEAWNLKYLGVFDAVGVVMSVMKMLKPLEEERPDPHNMALFLKHAFKETTLMSMSAADVLGINRCCKLVAVRDNVSILDLILVMSDCAVHRVAVVDRHNRLINFVTQTHIAQLLADNIDLIASLAAEPISALGLGSDKSVVSIDYKAHVAEAFDLMNKKNVSAIAVTGAYGAITGVISAFDVRAMLHKNRLYKMLHAPVGEFLVAANEDRVDAIHPAISCTEDEPLGLVMRRLLAARVHRVFVIDQNRVPISVVSYSDIFRVLVAVPADWSSRHHVVDLNLHTVDKPAPPPSAAAASH